MGAFLLLNLNRTCYNVGMGLKDTEVCSEKNCYRPYYAKWLCRKHYRRKRGRQGIYKKEYEKRKKDPKYKEMKKRSDAKYRDKLKKSGILSKKQSEYYKNWISKKKNYLKKKKRIAIDHNEQHFGGNRNKVLKRDSFCCVDCGIKREEHKEKYGFDLNVHHIDGNGWNKSKKEKNNNLENLVTLCHSCHRKRHLVDMI